MGFKLPFDKSKLSGTRFIRGINIPPQPTVPKMPPVQSPKKKNENSENHRDA
jgi:hypothetical protein